MEPCLPLTPQQKLGIENFVKQWYKLAPMQSVSLIENESVDSACYRKLVFRASIPAPLLTLYLAPDGKHLVSGVMDLRVDPAVTQRNNQEQLNAQLTSNALLVSPESNAPVKLVVFSDFQCPYCKRFSEFVHQLTAGERAKIQIIYRQRPLSIHTWARDAAELTECAALQNKGAFWKLHDFLFAHQEEISKESLQTKSLDFLSRETAVNSKALLACMSEKGYEGPLRKDEQLAMDLGINTTPTVFVNGRRTNIRSVDDLRTALSAAIPKSENASVCRTGTTKPAICLK
jgi:protein-disulfide isomerase